MKLRKTKILEWTYNRLAEKIVVAEKVLKSTWKILIEIAQQVE